MALVACALLFTSPMIKAEVTADASSPDAETTRLQIEAMQAQIEALQEQLNALKQRTQSVDVPVTSVAAEGQVAVLAPDEAASEDAAAVDDARAHTPALADTGISVGGAVRFQYSREGYNADNRRRNGDGDFDIFRLDLRGTVGGVTLDAQWRWFQYMSAMHHAWLGYDFDENSQLQVGLTRIPFGNQPYNSHSYFFSSNYYMGLEDTYAMGAQYIYDSDPWNVQLAFFKNDGMGGVDGYVSDRTASYSYNVTGVRQPGEGIFDDPSHPAGAVNSMAGRFARTFAVGDDLSIEAGASLLHGKLRDATSSIGDYSAWALHANADWRNWNVQAQALRYDYDVDGGADRLAVGAYGFYDSIAARADSYSFNVAYHLPVSWGPIGSLDFYNDHSLVNNKSGNLPATRMNVLGVAVAAGSLYTYLDYVIARNQPFIGGSMAGEGETEHRFNVNFGFYF